MRNVNIRYGSETPLIDKCLKKNGYPPAKLVDRSEISFVKGTKSPKKRVVTRKKRW